MSTVEGRGVLPYTARLLIYIDVHKELFLSIINLLCKIFLAIAILITIFSNQWARSLDEPNKYTGYKNRCAAHRCRSSDADPTWLIDLIGFLSMINLLMELSNIFIMKCCSSRPRKIDILLGKKNSEKCLHSHFIEFPIGVMFILSFITSECGIIVSIHMGLYAVELPMGYAFYWFLFRIVCSILDWGFSLKRMVSQ